MVIVFKLALKYILRREKILLREINICLAAICDKMHKLALIDDSYNMIEFESLRGQYQQALYRLVTVARSTTGSENIPHVPRY